MTPAQLRKWVAAGESETQEFKRSTGQRREAAKTLCAMLNHRGGRVLFGVEPDGRVVGQAVSDDTMRHLAEEIARIDPPVFPEIERIAESEGHEVVVVVVAPGPNLPYSYKGEPYRRIASTTASMSRDEFNRLLVDQHHGERRWEIKPATGWTAADLDLGELTQAVDEAVRRGRLAEPGTRDPDDLLRGLALTRDGSLTRAAVVLFGRGVRLVSDFPQCLLRVAKFRGTDKREFLDNRQFHGHAFELLRQAERFLRDSLPIAGRFEPENFRRLDVPAYPPLALREALANAFCHRDYAIGGGSVGVAIYDDRVEITSAGSLHFGLTAASLFLPHESRPWNPLIARVLHRCGVIEAWGSGTLRMAELTEQAGLPRPEIDETVSTVTVRFRPSAYLPPQRVSQNLTDRQRLILSVVREHADGVARRGIRERLERDVADWQLRDDLTMLRRLRLIEGRGRGAGARWVLVEPPGRKVP